MASDKQTQANQQNATHSTGPRTPEGKARAALNAVRHGLLARACVLPEEDHDQFVALLAGLEEEHQPVGPEETYLVEQIAASQFRMARLHRIEIGFLDAQAAHYTKWDRRDAGLRDLKDRYDEPASLPPNLRFDAHTRLLGRVFQGNSQGDGFSRLARYATAIQRTYFGSLKMLLELQDRRTRPSPSAKPTARNEPNSRPPADPPEAPSAPLGAPPPASAVPAPIQGGPPHPTAPLDRPQLAPDQS